ncbi:MAG: hypothetical protein ACI4VS_03960 [Candidatus Nanosyncoccaceae bacterium]
MTELTSKNLYDYLSKNNAKQRKIERMLEVFDADQVKIEELLMAGESWGIFIYDAEDGWRTQDFAKIDSKKFFDFVYQGVVPTSTPKKAEKKAEPAKKTVETKKTAKKPTEEVTEKATDKAAERPEVKSVKKEAPKQIRKITETPKNLATATVEEKIIQKPFTLRGLYSVILKHSDEGLPEAKIYEYFKVQEEDLRFVLDYLEYKGFFRHDTMSKWFAVPDLAKDPMLMKTLVGLRNSAILNREFKKKAIRSSGK